MFLMFCFAPAEVLRVTWILFSFLFQEDDG